MKKRDMINLKEKCMINIALVNIKPKTRGKKESNTGADPSRSSLV